MRNGKLSRYILDIIDTYNLIKSLAKETPNDMELGKKVRSLMAKEDIYDNDKQVRLFNKWS